MRWLREFWENDLILQDLLDQLALLGRQIKRMTEQLDEHLGHNTKQGPSVVRWLIVESAWRAIKNSPSLLSFYERVRHGQDKRKKIAIVATGRKMLSIMRAMQQTGECFNEKLVLEQRQFEVVEKPEEKFRRRNDFFN